MKQLVVLYSRQAFAKEGRAGTGPTDQRGGGARWEGPEWWWVN